MNYRVSNFPTIVPPLVVLPVLLLVSLASDARCQPLPPIGVDSASYQISLNVHLVVLEATVRGRDEQAVSNLRQRDFEIYEDGVLQSIRLFRHEDIPVTVGLVVDHSGSMRRKLTDVVTAARTFVQSSNPDDEMFIVNFNEKATMGILPAAIRFTSRSSELERAITGTPAAGQTALYDAIIQAGERVRDGSRDKKVLVVISDGGDNASKHTLLEVLNMAGHSNIIVYAIGIFDEEDPDRNPGALRRLARATGGEAYFPAQLNEVVSICERIARDIRHQYTLGYTSTNVEQSGGYRAVRVVARSTGGKKLAVRTRAGYLATGDSGTSKGDARK